jgi:hypothetical protein
MAREARARHDPVRSPQKGRASMSPESLQMVLALLVGFAVAGLCSTGYQLTTNKLPSFHLLTRGPKLSTFAALSLLIVAAPFLIMRNILTTKAEPRFERFQFVFLGTMIAGFWSAMSGMVVIMAFQAVFLV